MVQLTGVGERRLILARIQKLIHGQPFLLGRFTASETFLAQNLLPGCINAQRIFPLFTRSVSIVGFVLEHFSAAATLDFILDVMVNEDMVTNRMLVEVLR